jgi:hypothetical protein
MKKPNKKLTWLARALGAGAMLTTSAAAFAGLLPSMNEKPMPAWTMVYGTEKPQQKPTMLLFGVVQPGYSYIQASPPKATNVVGNGQFKFYRLRPGIRGSIGPNIDYFFLAEFGNNPTNPNRGVFGSAHVLDGNVTLNYIPGVHVEVGQMMVPFAEEGLTAAGVLPWINYSPATYNIAFNDFAATPAPNAIAGPTGSGDFNAGREMGVMAFNQFVHGPMAVDYAVGYFNGTGLSQTQSSMGHPDQAFFHGGVDFGPFGIAGSYETGRQTFTGVSYHQNKYAIDVRYGNYIKDPLWLWYEYQHANNGQPAAQGNGTARGWFAAAGFHPVKKYMGVFRYSSYNTENLDSVTLPGNGAGVFTPTFGTPTAGGGVINDPASPVSLNEDSLIGVYLARKGVRYYVEFDHTTYNNSSAPADNAVSVMLSVPFGARLLH